MCAQAGETRAEVWDDNSLLMPASATGVPELESATQKSYTRAARLLGYGR